LLPAIVNVSVNGSSRGAGGSGDTFTGALLKTCRSRTARWSWSPERGVGHGRVGRLHEVGSVNVR
jgi:hypothetical protein